MNRIKNIFAVFIAVGTLSGCLERTLDKSPTLSFTEENSFENFQVTQTYALGFYTTFPGYNLGIIEKDWNADLMMVNNQAQDVDWIWGRKVVPTTDPIWNFSFIRRINIMLKNIENSSMSEAEINHWRAVGYFFRAYDYFEKIAAFGDVPWIDRMVTDSDELLYAPRTPRNEVAQKILEQLHYAEEHIMEPGTNGIVNNSLSVDVVRAMISRFGLFEGTWRKYHGLGGEEAYLRASVAASEKLLADHPALHPNYDEVFNSASLDGVNGILLFKQYEMGILTHILTSRHR